MPPLMYKYKKGLKTLMDIYTTYDKKECFSIPFSDYMGTDFDNREALGFRMTLLLVEEGSGIATIDGLSIPYIAPCTFCLNEKEHCVIRESDHSKLRALLLHPSVINSALDFDNMRYMPEDVPLTVMQDRDMMSYFFERQNDFRGKFYLGPFAERKFINMFADIHNQITSQNNSNWPCRSRSYVMALIFMLYDQYHEGFFESDAKVEMIKEEFRPILLYVYQNYENKIKVEDITDKFHLSRTTISKMFRQNVGESFLAYLNRLRINRASSMLRDTMLPVGEIMYQVGFSDPVHFLRTFKKLTNMTPTTYREKYNCL